MRIIFDYYLWVPLVIVVYMAMGYFSFRLNTDKGTLWFILNWLLPIIPIWSFIAMNTRRLVFDGLLFDVILIVVYTFSVMYFTKTFDTLKIHNYIGLTAMIIGLILFKKS